MKSAADEAAPLSDEGGKWQLNYATLWRWHFYAGLFVLPFILILATTGSIYLFRPQIERWEERAYIGLSTDGAVSADQQLAATMAANPGARFNHYRLPRQLGDAAMIQLALADGALREVYVSPQGRVMGALDPSARIAQIAQRIHGTLLIGKWGDWIVELAASWTIVMVLTGLYLWFPRPWRLAGVLYPRLALKGRALITDIHRVCGFWAAGLVLVFLLSGLPWTSAWGGAFQWVRTEMGWVKGAPDWRVEADGGHGAHSHHMMDMMAPAAPPSGVSQPLSVFVAKADSERMAYPVLVMPPHAPRLFGPPTGNVWTVTSLSQNRWLRREAAFDPATGSVVARSGFADQHVIDRVVNTGVSFHEGQLFGPLNQLLGLMTALTLIAVSVLGVVAWLQRRPGGKLGAPPAAEAGPGLWVVGMVCLLAVLLPLFGASLILIGVLDRTWRLLRRMPAVR